ncbi:MAG: radical SAM family heme chaperone HemW [Sedimentisphaerales bacterium]|jgi:oxygen-independent coproporphyrinogen-3 oxidase
MVNNNLPKSVYIHIPFCKTKCAYCGFYSKSPQEFDVGKLLDTEIAELKKSAFKKPVNTLYIGGGNPSCIGQESLCGFLKTVLTLTGKVDEFTIEINPADADKNLLIGLKSLGVNRISIGVQSFVQKELDFLGRRYSIERIDQIIKTAKQAGFENISIDLIFAIPGSTLRTWRQNLKKAIETGVTHISAYSLTYEKNTPLEKTMFAGKIKTVTEELDRKMYETAIETLADAGFEHYEISNFAKPGFQCRHNLTYWKNDFYIGIGPAASSYIPNWRTENISDIDKYAEYIENDKNPVSERIKISPVEKASQAAVLGLRLIKGINLTEYKQKTGFDIFELFKDSIEKNLKLKLLQLKNDNLGLTAGALPIADSVLCDFAQPD